MRVALITTTINVPRVLSLYRAHDPDVMFFVAADVNTPAAAFDFCAEELGECVYITAHEQEKKYYKSSNLLGFRTDSRRNYALLEAMKWKADLIISADDDMIPTNELFFNSFTRLFQRVYVNDSQIPQTCKFNGLQLGIANQWFDAAPLTIPNA